MLFRKIVVLAAVSVMLLTLTGCELLANEPDTVITTDPNLYLEQIQASEEAAQRAEDEKRAEEAGGTLSPEPTWGTPLPFEQTTYDWTWPTLETGKLVVTVTGAQVVTHEKDYPTEGGTYPYDTGLNMGEGWTEYYQYPDFILEDGSFIEGVFLILVDVTVENHGARNYTLDSELNAYEDPYMFKANNIICLSEVELPRVWDVNYFSLYESHDESVFGFHLEPGETVDFTVGFLVGDKWDGSTRDISVLAACYRKPPYTDRLVIPLGLSNEGIEW